ncbi:MAG: membrane protein insertase YidC [Bacteriovoracia bacterium]
MDRRTIVALTLCLLIFVGWQELYLKKQVAPVPPPAPAANTASTAPPPVATGAEAAARLAPAIEPAKNLPETNEAVSMHTGEAFISSRNAVLSNWSMKDYQMSQAADARHVDLHTLTFESENIRLGFDSPELAYLNQVNGRLTRENGALIWLYEDANVRIQRDVKHAADAVALDLTWNIQFKKTPAKVAFVSMLGQAPKDDPEAHDRKIGYFRKELHKHALNSLPEKTEAVEAPVKWVALMNRYFTLAMVNQSAQPPAAVIQPLGVHQVIGSLAYPITGNSLIIPLKVYFGPKHLDLLRAVDVSLDTAVDFGWFTIIAYPLLWLLKWFYGFFHNYGVAIICLTLVVRLITFPLNYKSMVNMKKMAVLQPQIQAMREKYKDDPQAMNKEMLTFMRTQGYNPVAGCLPILVQMPIFFALYQVLYSAVELYQAPFALWIHDLSLKDPYYVTPILVTAVFYFQQKLTPNTVTDPAQQKMLQFMPIIFGVFMANTPSGLGVYFFVNALSGIIQQQLLNKKLGPSTQVPTVVARAR